MSDLGNKEIMAKNIQHYMGINEKTRKDMCEAIEIKYSTFSDWVNGKKYPRIDKIELMANYFGIEKSDLIENKDKIEVSLPQLTKKDELDISKSLTSTLEQLEFSQEALMFDGEPIDDETKELLKISLENSIRLAKQLAKQKYTPKKYRKDNN